jgi:hypothetical protein
MIHLRCGVKIERAKSRSPSGMANNKGKGNRRSLRDDNPKGNSNGKNKGKGNGNSNGKNNPYG